MLIARKHEALKHLRSCDGFPFRQWNEIRHFAHALQQSLTILQRHALLVVVTKNNGFTHHHFTTIGLELLGEHVEERSLTRSVAAHDTYLLFVLKYVIKTAEHLGVSKRLSHLVKLDNLAPHATHVDFKFEGIGIIAAHKTFLQFMETIHA